MKKILGFLAFLFLLSCDNSTVNNNPFLPNYTVNFTVNLNLPEGQNLLIPGGTETFNQGIRGVVIYYVGGEVYRAFDLACPHIELQDCSQMTVENLFMTCPCDEERFQLTNGAPENGAINYAAKSYFVTKSDPILRITN